MAFDDTSVFKRSNVATRDNGERCFCELTQGEDIIGIAAVVGFKRFLIDAETKTAIGTRLRCFHLDVVIDIFL